MAAVAPQPKGVIVPMATPIDKDERIDEGATRKVISFLVDAGVHGIFVLGTAGEGGSFRDAQADRLLAVAREAVPPDVGLYAGALAGASARALDRVRAAEHAGANYAVVLLPSYHHVKTPDEALAHFEWIAVETEIPLVIYNLPNRAVYSLPAQVVARLAESDRYFGIKDSSRDWELFESFLTQRGRPDFSVLQGDSWATGKAYLAGADGAVSITANASPRLAVACYEAAVRGERERMEVMDQAMVELRDAIGSMNVSAGAKAALAGRGLCDLTVTRPVQSASRADAERLSALAIELEERCLGD